MLCNNCCCKKSQVELKLSFSLVKIVHKKQYLGGMVVIWSNPKDLKDVTSLLHSVAWQKLVGAWWMVVDYHRWPPDLLKLVRYDWKTRPWLRHIGSTGNHLKQGLQVLARGTWLASSRNLYLGYTAGHFQSLHSRKTQYHKSVNIIQNLHSEYGT